MSEIPDPLRPRLFDAADHLGLALSDPEADALLAYLALLQRWNATYNLTAVRDPERMLTQHLADCLAVIGPLRRQLGTPRAARLLDVGSGGGLPGIVIAILCPDLDVTCVDTVGKKSAFIQQVAASLHLRNLHSQHARVEQLKAPSFDVVTSRAFASLADFVSLTRQHLTQDGFWLAMKGKDPADERAALPADIDVFHVEQLAVPGLDADRCLVWMRPRRSL
ncbi:MAG TPA: 16S rRNA (guanine(527)-N(7))-methyltransferase RsmG [Burkholderiaceae bacterium]